MLTKEQEMLAAILGRESEPADPSAQLLAAAWALPDDEIRQINIDPPHAASTVLGAAGRLGGLRDSIAKEAPSTDMGELDKLETYGKALMWAHLQCLALPLPADVLQALADEGHKLRRRLRKDAIPLCERGLIEPSSLESCEGKPGYQNLATELGILVTVFREAWERIRGKCAIEEEELERARRLSQALARRICAENEAASKLKQARELRARIFTLVIRCYEQARRAVEYVRYFEKDADKFAPSLYGDRRRKKAAEPEEKAPEAPPTPGVGASLSTGNPSEAPNAPVADGGSAGAAPAGLVNEPFMEPS